MDGYAYDVHPYVLMNYNDDYESVTTVAHEWGHAMHSYLANKAQPFVTSNYAIFIAEIASTFNEELLLQRVLKEAKSDSERLYYLGYALEQLRGTFYRQAMFAEFERNIHARVDKGEPLTGDALTKTYCEILKRYHGAKEGVVDIDDAYCVEWAYIPHFYNGFYVYQYATSIAASALFAQQVGEGRARRARSLPRLAEGRRLGLSVRAREEGGRGSRHAGAVPGAGRADELDHGRDRGDPRQAEEMSVRNEGPVASVDVDFTFGATLSGDHFMQLRFLSLFPAVVVAVPVHAET